MYFKRLWLDYIYIYAAIQMYLLLLLFVHPQEDMRQGVHGRFLDQSTSVREAAVELVGKFILIHPELTEQYYDMLSNRILVSMILCGVDVFWI